MPDINLITIFLTGLLTGGLTCMAVQGGLLAATLAQREEEKLKKNLEGRTRTSSSVPILSFLLAKLLAYTLFGVLLGWFGSFFELSQTAQLVMQIAVGVFMIGTALNILNVHPIFRYFIIQPPKFLTRLVRKQSKSKDIFAPALLGGFTIFIPCGTTQAMMALAIASGNPVLGAAVLFAFVLGTSPVFFILGYFAARLGEALHQKFLKAAAYAIIILAVFNLNNAIALSGSRLTLDSLWSGFWCTFSFCSSSQIAAAQTETAVTEATIEIGSYGYTPNSLFVKAGSNITLRLVNNGGRGCAQAFTIPALGFQKVVPRGSSETIQFTAPSSPTQIAFMCSMGMYRGVINVI